MKKVRSVASLLFWLTKTLGIIYGIIWLYGAICLAAYRFTTWNGLPVSVDSGRFSVFYPFTHTTFLTGDYTSAYVIPMFCIVAFYVLFLLTMSRVMNAFMHAKLFTPANTRRLEIFYRLNFLAPVSVVILSLLLDPANSFTSDYISIALLHCVIGVFAFFMTALFRQGFVLQDEQDHTL